MASRGREEAIAGDHFSPDIVEFIRLLHRHGVRYVIVGGEAVIYHGFARFTGDVDFYYGSSPENIDRLWDVLVEFWPGGAVPGIANKDELAEPATVVQFGCPPNRIDLLNRIEAVPFERAWENHIDVPFEVEDPPLEIPFLDLDSLTLNKQAVGRNKDLEDLRYLQKAREQRDARD